jgi:2,3-bisphosphoglycerate-independent phosphoglycerate mutase
MTLPHRPLVLIILDGFGHRDTKDANAIATANTPNLDQLLREYPHTLISGSGRCVGLPDGQMGNSEVGHLNMGAGRIVHQDLTRIDLAIENGEFFSNPILVAAMNHAQKAKKTVHVMGLLSPGGVHSHENHLFALAEMGAKLGLPQLYLHSFLDGRDTPPKSAMASLRKLDSLCRTLGNCRIASIIGRYYAMDRDKRWERVECAYRLLTEGIAPFQSDSAEDALALAYARGETDEFVQATSIQDVNETKGIIQDGDVIIFANFRADRARELTEAFINPEFQEFHRQVFPLLSDFVCLSEYDCRFKASVAFPPQPMTHLLADCLSEAGLTQLRIAETEKYAHVTFFFNGGIERPYPGEDRILIPSPKVATYDLKPEMSAPELTKSLVEAIHSGRYDVIICNYANADMVGHSGDFQAAVKAIEAIDQSLGLIKQAIVESGGEMIITADHGNAEQMFDYETNQPHTAHTSDPVPFIYVGRKATIIKTDGKLSDIAPTMLYLLNLSKPNEMTGKSLVKLAN